LVSEPIANFNAAPLNATSCAGSNFSGIVFWGGYQRQWDDTQGWWHATLDFIAKL